MRRYQKCVNDKEGLYVTSILMAFLSFLRAPYFSYSLISFDIVSSYIFLISYNLRATLTAFIYSVIMSTKDEHS